MATTRAPLKRIGILTAGGDCPGLNAVIRGITKSLDSEGIEVYGFLDGFKGLIENRYVLLHDQDASGLLTQGGTIIRTSRVKPHKYPLEDGTFEDRTKQAAQTYLDNGLDCLVCLGGGGTQKNAFKLMEYEGINVITAPKTIDNDVWGTDICFGFDTGMFVATEAIDRLHTTASSHHRVIIVDIMGNKAGWLALGAGVAGGADVILIPEIPYSLDIIGKSLKNRVKMGKTFSIVAVAEGAVDQSELDSIEEVKRNAAEQGIKLKRKDIPRQPKEVISAILAEHLESETGLETRYASLGYIQRGGIPTPTDRLLSTAFGTKVAECARNGEFGVMVAKRGDDFVSVPLKDIVGRRREVPLDHPWIHAARSVGTCLGDTLPHGYR